MRKVGLFVDFVAQSEKLSPSEELNVLSRRHLNVVFGSGNSKAPGFTLSDEADPATGKFTLTVNPIVTNELERAFGSDFASQHYAQRNIGTVLAHTDDYIEGKAGLNSKALLKVLRTAEEQRISRKNIGAALV